MIHRGQTLVLLALTMLLLTLMVLMTLSIGTAAARKADLANAADAAAYSTAVATARSFNTGALLNRTMVSHYVAMAGVEAQMVYSSTVHNYFNLAGVMFRLYDDNDSNGDGTVDYVDSYTEPYKLTGCGRRTTEVRDASYEMWHIALRSLRPPGGVGVNGDNVNAYCQGGNCSYNHGWLAQNEAVLEEAAAEQGHAIHDAIWDLAHIQRETYRNLEEAVKDGTYAKRIASAAGIGTSTVRGESEAREELDNATGRSPGLDKAPPMTFQRPLTEAILGTRRRREPLLLPTVPENLPPMVKQMKAITDAAFANYPGQPFTVDFQAANVSADFANQSAAQRMIEDPLISGSPTPSDDLELFPSLQYGHARAVNGRVTTIYRDVCLGRTPIRFVSGTRRWNPAANRWVDLTKNGRMEVFIRTAGPGQGGGKHIDYGEEHLDGTHWKSFGSGSNVGGCHGLHQHYLATDVNVHDLDTDTLPHDVLAFALPDNDPDINEKGAGGVWGQPVLPVMFTQKHNPKKDPFSLDVGFRFRRSGKGAQFDMRDPVDTALAPAAAIAYYHRRGHLGEPPNLLNPFWHATLVPIEIDERKAAPGKAYDPTEESQQAAKRMRSLIESAYPPGSDRKDVRAAYDGLKHSISGMSDPEPANGR